MNSKTILLVTLLLSQLCLYGQVESKRIDNIEVLSTKATKLGHTAPISQLIAKAETSPEKKLANKRMKKAPDNFKGRRGQSKAVDQALEHLGPDPILQPTDLQFAKTPNEPLVNVDGISNFRSPHDPTGDVSNEYYVQAVNVTTVGVFDLEGNLVQSFSMNTLWSEFNVSSEGDPIVLYDESVNRWILTEFTDPANVLIAISDDQDPLGGYTAYNFTTPEFPDYPKYAITPDALVFTSNEGTTANLHQYFIDINGLYTGADNVDLQRIEILGNTNTEAGFYVSTPVDWNGSRLPFDNKPIAMRINDSSWAGGPAQDQVELYSFDIDFNDPSNSFVTQTSIVVSPFDSYPCSSTGFGFQCVPQLGGDGLDAIPEVILNLPHLRNFGSYESLVFTFVTDITDGDNLSGLRWTELRRVAGGDWELYQEGTYGFNDGFDRFMGSIAINERGDIGLAYNITSDETYVGMGYTGRNASDPLGVMTLDETIVVEGQGTISAFGRFGDYPQMSVSPNGRTFWYTSEYAGNGPQVSATRILAFELAKDSFDLATISIDNPTTSSSLSATELVTATFLNSGIMDMSNFEVSLLFGDAIVETQMINDTLAENEQLSITFDTPVDLSQLGIYEVGAIVSSVNDANPLNDTLILNVSKIPRIEANIGAEIKENDCIEMIPASVRVNNLGEEVLNTIEIEVSLNGIVVDTIVYEGAIAYQQSAIIKYDVTDGLVEGNNLVTFRLVSFNGEANDNFIDDNTIDVYTELLSAESFFTLVFLTDEYPNESTYEIYSSDGNTLITSGTFTNESTEHQIEVCASLDSCYIIRVLDAAGDGICCSFGEGNFSILNNLGEPILVNDGDFAAMVEESFCAGDRQCLLTATITIEDASSPSSMDGSIIIDAINGVAPYEYSIDGGVQYQDSPVFTNLPLGDYPVFIKDADNFCIYDTLVQIKAITSVTSTGSSDAVISIAPNPTEGVFSVTIENYTTPAYQLDATILDLSGRVIQNRKIGKYDGVFMGDISLYDYPNGIYFFSIRNKDFSIVRKIIKI